MRTAPSTPVGLVCPDGTRLVVVDEEPACLSSPAVVRARPGNQAGPKPVQTGQTPEAGAFPPNNAPAPASAPTTGGGGRKLHALFNPFFGGGFGGWNDRCTGR